MKTITNYTEISQEACDDFLSRFDAENLELKIECLHGWKMSGYGHWKIGFDVEVIVNGNSETVPCEVTTTNSILKDCWGDSEFTEELDWYDSDQSVTDAYFYECLTVRNIEKIMEIIWKLENLKDEEDEND